MHKLTLIKNQVKVMFSNPIHLFRDSLMVNAGYLLGVYIVGSVGGLLFWGLTTRLYSPESVGLASAIIAAIQLLSSIAILGMGAGLIRFLANSDNPQNTLNTASTLVVLTSAVLGSVYLLGIQLWSPTLQFLGRRPDVAIIFVVFLIVTVLGMLCQAAFQAFRKAHYAFWQVAILNVLRLVLIAVSVSAETIGIMTAVIVATILANIIGLFVFIPSIITGFQIRLHWSRSVIGRLVPYSSGSYAADLLYRAPMLLAPLLALEMLGPESSAHAYICWMLASTISSPGLALAGSAFAEGAYSPRNLRKTLAKAAWYAIPMTTLFAILIGFGAPWILGLFGKSYASGAVILLRWLMLAVPFMALNTLYFSALRVKSRIVELVILSAISAVIALAIPFFSIQQIGLESTGVGWLVAQISLSLIASRHLLKIRLGMKNNLVKNILSQAKT